jgi:site-specific recombinase XerD
MTHHMTDLIDAHLTYLRAGAYSPRTVTAAAKVLRRVDAALPYGLDNAATAELVDWLARPGWSTQTRATYRGAIVRFYRWATRDDDRWLDFDPSTGLRRPRVNRGVPRPATDDHVHACLTRAGQPFRLHCVLAAYAGLRPIEIADLDRGDVTEHNIAVRHGKGDKPAVIPTHPVVWAALRHLPAGPVTRRRRGRPADARWVCAATADHLHRLGLPVTLRNLRHWYATTLLERCHDLRVVQELMRHASVATTQVYTQVVDERRRAAVATLPVLTGPDGPADPDESASRPDR